jgi:hypothetical protein
MAVRDAMTIEHQRPILAATALLAFLLPDLKAQICLTLSTAAVEPGGTASLDLSLNASASDPPPAALQWTLQFPSSAIRSLTVDDGPAVTTAGKTVICAPKTDGYTCLAVGGNLKTIGNGVIAKITAALAPDAATATIQVVNPLAASPEGYFIPITARGGIITTANVSSDRRLRPPLRRIAGVQCTRTQ